VGREKKHAAESRANSINPRGIRGKNSQGTSQGFEVAVATISVFATTMHKKARHCNAK